MLSNLKTSNEIQDESEYYKIKKRWKLFNIKFKYNKFSIFTSNWIIYEVKWYIYGTFHVAPKFS